MEPRLNIAVDLAELANALRQVNDALARLPAGTVLDGEYPSWWEAVRIGWRLGPAAADDPLPPLDDLDEGLHCCNRHYPTFHAYLTHRRGHHDG
jgi:hypothetical protein